MAEFTVDKAKKNLVSASKNIITGAGLYKNIPVFIPEKPYIDGEGNMRYIANLSAMTLDNATKAKALFEEGNFTEASNLRLTASIFPEQHVNLYGLRSVDIQVGMVDIKDGDGKVTGQELRVTSVKSPDAMKVTSFDFGFEEEVKVNADAPVESFEE